MFTTWIFFGRYLAIVYILILMNKPVLTFRHHAKQRSLWLRKKQMIVPLTISGGLLITLLLLSQQVIYLRTKNPGFEKDNIVNVELRHPDKAPAFASELSRIPQVKDVSFSTATPGNEVQWATIMSLSGGDDPLRQEVTMIMGDDHYCTLYGLQLLTGRFPMASDTTYISHAIPPAARIIKAVVNEKLVQALGFDSNEAALGKRFWIGMNSGNTEIVGVVADVNTASLRDAVKPVLITQFPGVYSQAGIKIHAGADILLTIAAIETAWKKAFPEGVFEFTFLDEKTDAFYKAETEPFRWSSLF